MKIQLNFEKGINLLQEFGQEDWQKDIYNFLKEWYSDSKYITTKTSGSTGIPKEIELSKEAMIQSAQITCDFLQLKEGDRAFVCMPTRYIAGKMMLIRSIVRKLNLTVIKPCSNPLQHINEEFVFSAMTPMQVENSLDKLDQIKKILIGGAQISESLQKKLIGKKTQIFESFGMTETISHIALKNINKQSDYFQVMPGVKIDTDDRNCLIIKTLFLSEEVVTNDVISIKENKKEFKWLGRIDHVINSGGIKLFPEIIENKLKKFIFQDFYISSKKDPYLGEKVILITEKEIDDSINIFKSLDKYEIPKEIIYKKINKTPTGKLIREKLE